MLATHAATRKEAAIGLSNGKTARPVGKPDCYPLRNNHQKVWFNRWAQAPVLTSQVGLVKLAGLTFEILKVCSFDPVYRE